MTLNPIKQRLSNSSAFMESLQAALQNVTKNEKQGGMQVLSKEIASSFKYLKSIWITKLCWSQSWDAKHDGMERLKCLKDINSSESLAFILGRCSQLFLKVNSAFWDAGIFFKAVKEYLEERKIHLKSLIKKQRMGKRLMMKMNKMYL
jgi:hypothetical protein